MKSEIVNYQHISFDTWRPSRNKNILHIDLVVQY